MPGDIESQIVIKDGFTEPLKRLTELSIESADKVGRLKNVVSEMSQSFTSDLSKAFDTTMMSSKAIDQMNKLLSKQATVLKERLNDKAASVLLKRELTNLSIAQKKFNESKAKGVEPAKAVREAKERIKLINEEKDTVNLLTQATKLKAKETAETIKVNAKLLAQSAQMKARSSFLLAKSSISNAGERALLSSVRGGTGVYLGARDRLSSYADIVRGNGIKGGAMALKEASLDIAADFHAAGKAATNAINNTANNISRITEQTKIKAKSALEMEGFRMQDRLNRLKSTKAGRLFGKYSDIYAGSESVGAVAKAMRNDAFAGLKAGFDKFKSTEFGQISIGFAKDLANNIGIAIIQTVAFAAFNKLKEQFIAVFTSAREAIQNSLNELNVSDKLNAMYGKAGENAKNRMLDLANEIGESSAMVTEMAANAATQGIGTKHFDRIMRFSDKISKLKLGETTENAASNLISNIKSGHDASSMAQMLGGGQRMERRLRRAGFERALNRGNVDKALDIAEKIAEQAGYTDEKYKSASNTMSQNYKKIENIFTNVKKNLSEIYTRQMEPMVERVKEFMESDTFKTVVSLLEKAVKFIGEKVTNLMNGLLDNLPFIAGLFATGMVAQSYFFIKNLKGIVGLLGIVKVGLIKIGTLIGAQGMVKALKELTAQQIKVLAKEKAIAAVKMVGPWVALLAVVGGVAYAIFKCTGVSETFVGFLSGGFKYAMNIAYNIAAFFADTLPRKLKIFALTFKGGMLRLKSFIRQHVGQLISWILNSLKDLLGPIADLLSEAGIDLNAGANYMNNWGKEEGLEADKIAEEIKRLSEVSTEFKDTMEGVEEAYKSNGQSVVKELKALFGLQKKSNDKEEEIQTNTGELVRQGSQEEDLRWLKAFSDRQITSSYSSMTSNVQYLNQYGTSETTQRETMRRIAARPGRYASLH